MNFLKMNLLLTMVCCLFSCGDDEAAAVDY